MRTRTILTRAVALAAVLCLFSLAVAQADGFIDDTKVRAHVKTDTAVPEGTEVVIAGKLKPDRPFCRKDSKVVLRAYGENQGQRFPGGKIDKDRTNERGHYRFTLEIDEQIRVRVWFKGKVGGVHPDIKTCKKDRSRTVTFTTT